MRKSQKLRLALCLALPASTAFALDLKGVRIGMTLDELQTAFPAGSEAPGKPREGGMSCNEQRTFCGVGIGTLAGIPTQLQVTLQGGHVADAYAGSLQPRQFDQVAEALRVKFGEPTDTARGVVQNRAGGTFPNTSLEWRLKDGVVRASRYFPGAPTMSISQVEISSIEWAAREAARHAEKVKDM